MKAIYIESHTSNMDKLNEELKNCHGKLLWERTNEYGNTILIFSNYTRSDKLKKINKISNEAGINNNSI